MNITNSEFGSNSATNGGALFIKWGAGIANITGSNFHDNHADANNALGGAVLLFDGALATVTGSTFMSNTTDYGEAIFIHQPTTNPTTLTMSNSTLSHNQSWETGGAIYQETRKTTMGCSELRSNISGPRPHRQQKQTDGRQRDRDDNLAQESCTD